MAQAAKPADAKPAVEYHPVAEKDFTMKAEEFEKLFTLSANEVFNPPKKEEAKAPAPKI
jgi:hypothetical protein